MSLNRSNESDEAKLVQRARLGEAAAFDQLVVIHTPRLYRIVRRMVGDQSEAEEIIQEAWLRAWRAFPRSRADRRLSPWLVQIALNVARDRWRKKEPLNFADLGGEEIHLPDPGPSPEERMARKEALEDLMLGVEALRSEYRIVIALRYDAGYSYQEIADLLGTPLNTVRTHLSRAKVALRSWMESKDG